MLDGLFLAHRRQVGVHRNVIVDIELVGGKGCQAVFMFPVAVVVGKTLVIRHLPKVFVPVAVREET
jgi:hypothetical protein